MDEVNRLTCKISVSLGLIAIVFQFEIIAINVAVSNFLERNYIVKRIFIVTDRKSAQATLSPWE